MTTSFGFVPDLTAQAAADALEQRQEDFAAIRGCRSSVTHRLYAARSLTSAHHHLHLQFEARGEHRKEEPRIVVNISVQSFVSATESLDRTTCRPAVAGTPRTWIDILGDMSSAHCMRCVPSLHNNELFRWRKRAHAGGKGSV